MASLLEELVTRISFRFDPKGLEAYNKKLTEAKKNAGDAQRGLNDLRRSMVEAFSVRALASGLTGLIGGIVRTNAEFQVLRARLETVTGSQKAANAEFQRMQKLAIDTPFEMKNLVDALVALKAVGIEPTTERMLAFGDIAAANGRDITDMAAAVRGAVTGEFEMLKGLGIVVRTEGDQLAVHFRGNVERVKNDGKSIVEVIERIGRTDFAGGMKRQSETLAGAWNHLQDAIAAAETRIGEGGLNTALKEAADSIGSMIDNSSDLADIIGTSLGDVVRVLVEILKELLGTMEAMDRQKFRDNLNALKTVFLALVDVGRMLFKVLTSIVGVLGGPRGLIALLIAGKTATLAWNMAMASTAVESAKAASAMRAVSLAASGIGIGLAGAALILGQYERKLAALRQTSKGLAEDTKRYVDDNLKNVQGQAAQEQIAQIDAKIASLQAEDDRRRSERGLMGATGDLIGGETWSNAEAIKELQDLRASYQRRLDEVDQQNTERYTSRAARAQRAAERTKDQAELARLRKELRGARTKGEQKRLRKRINELEDSLGREKTDYSSKIKEKPDKLSASEKAVKKRLDEIQAEAELRAFYHGTGSIDERSKKAFQVGKETRAKLEDQIAAGGDISMLGGEFAKEAMMLRDVGILDDAAKATPPVITVSITRVDAPVDAKIQIPVTQTNATPQDIGMATKNAIHEVIEVKLRRAIEAIAPTQKR